MGHRSKARLGLAAITVLLVVGVALVGCGSSDTRSSGNAEPSQVEPAFALPTAQMSGKDAAALPAPPAATDPSDLFLDDAPGFLYGVWDPDRGVHLAGVGLSEIDGKRAMAADDSFRIGSITKTFTATAVLLLVDDGKVDLDKPVATYTGSLTDALPRGDTATVRETLGMMSGWPEYANNPEGPFGQVVTDPSHEFTTQELVDAAAGEDPTPTDVVTYVNTNYVVLGDLVARVSGMSFSDFVKNRILDPVGLDHTNIPDPTVTAEVTSHGYFNAGWADFPPEVIVPDDVTAAGGSGTDVTGFSTSVGGTAGNGVSTLEDLARWASADFGNVLLSAKTQKARLDGAPAAEIIPKSTYGLGLQILGDWHFHGGEIFGWESQLFANPTTGQVVVVNANACCGVAFQNLLLVTEAFPEDDDLSQLGRTINVALGN